MDYSNGDLTLQRYYEPIKLSFIAQPHDIKLGDAIWKNLEQLGQLTHITASGALAHVDAFKKFLATANTNNNIGNALAYGDRQKEGDGVFSRKLSEIDRNITSNAAKHGRVLPHLITIAALWDEFKTTIPEKTALVSRNHTTVIEALENQRAGAQGSKQTEWDARLATARENFAAYQSKLYAAPATSTELAAHWQTTARPAEHLRFSLGNAFGNLRTALTGAAPVLSARKNEHSG